MPCDHDHDGPIPFKPTTYELKMYNILEGKGNQPIWRELINSSVIIQKNTYMYNNTVYLSWFIFVIADLKLKWLWNDEQQ
jgi:hypothetical protein